MWPGSQLDGKDRMSSPHSEECSWAHVIEYEAYILGLASIVVGVAYGRVDTKSPIGLILHERQSWMSITWQMIN